jgi:hypothetical protein
MDKVELAISSKLKFSHDKIQQAAYNLLTEEEATLVNIRAYITKYEFIDRCIFILERQC